MPNNDVPEPVNRAEIEVRAQRLRALLGVWTTSKFNIILAIENELSKRIPEFFLEILPERELEILPKQQMGLVEAFTEFDPLRITIREDIYEGAYKGDVRSRFTVAHELGHLCLHWGCPRPRLAPGKQRFHRSNENQRLETEANQFAAALLIPLEVATRIRNPRHLASLCQVSDGAAQRRLYELVVHEEKLTPASVLDIFGPRLRA
jgi:Zn-dependent peptidase ImmA (M78 family)